MHFTLCKLYFNKIDLKNLEDWLKSIRWAIGLWNPLFCSEWPDTVPSYLHGGLQVYSLEG